MKAFRNIDRARGLSWLSCVCSAECDHAPGSHQRSHNRTKSCGKLQQGDIHPVEAPPDRGMHGRYPPLGQCPPGSHHDRNHPQASYWEVLPPDGGPGPNCNFRAVINRARPVALDSRDLPQRPPKRRHISASPRAPTSAPDSLSTGALFRSTLVTQRRA